MDPQILKLLQAADSVGKLESPVGLFSGMRKAEKKARELGPALSGAIGLDLKFEGPIDLQDAAHFAEFHHNELVPPPPGQYTAPGVTRGAEYCWAVAVQFSGFGNFVSCNVNESYAHLVKPGAMERARQILREAGYQLIPEECWDEPYQGWAEAHGVATWGNRFFGWN